jgi:competence protein ComEC
MQRAQPAQAIAIREWFWQAPLVPVALSATAGLAVERYVGVPLPLAALGILIGILGWLFARRSRFASFFLWMACAFLAALYLHVYRGSFSADDIGQYATMEPKLVRLRGTLLEEPVEAAANKNDPLLSIPKSESTRLLFSASEVQTVSGWQSTNGRVMLTVAGQLDDLHCGDEIEVEGWLDGPPSAANPGEWDWGEYLKDHRVRAEMHVKKTADAVVRIGEASWLNPSSWLAQIRGWGQRSLARNLPPREAAIGTALLLGDGSAMARAEWERYVRTGVIHVLAISGMHLIVLAALAWAILRVLGVRRQHGAVIVAVFLLSYAVMAGFRPPVQRAAITVAVACIGALFRRQTLPANNFALAWLTVIALHPVDPFSLGCQSSFLHVAVLTWGLGRWFDQRDEDPLARLRDEARSWPERLLVHLGRWIGRNYVITIVLGLVTVPLVASWHHVVPVTGFLIGPPALLLAAIALVSGFFLLLSDALGGFLSPIFALITRYSLAGCDGLVDLVDSLPLSHVYVPDIPIWWLCGFYLIILALLWLKPVWPRRRWLALTGAGWLGIGLFGAALPASHREMRVTFLAVGHGGCTVIETPDGRVLLYDAGAIQGPDVTRRTIAPFLWRQGITRIDEIFLSHADLDHFNGLVDLLDRFDVGLITCTPSFADKNQPGVRHTLAEIQRRGIATRIVKAGDRLTAGDVTFEVLHPPAIGPEGNENARSMVLLLTHSGNRILLTGDLEGQGQAMVLQESIGPVDVFMAPHHGSRLANSAGLVQWAHPKLVVACAGSARGPTARPDPYTAAGIPYWGTWPHGAITIYSGSTSLSAETYRTQERLALRKENGAN